MRFMMIVKGAEDSEAGKMPSEGLLNAMAKYNEELLKAGVLLDLAGLHPTSKGAHPVFDWQTYRYRRTLRRNQGTDRRLLAYPGQDKKPSIGCCRVPCPSDPPQDGSIELRLVFELSDFTPSPAVDRAGALGEELAKCAKAS
jgi:hypothetical protein